MSIVFGSSDTIQNSIVNYTQSIALATAAFDSWKNTIKALEQGETQTLDITNHSNSTPHSNTHNNSTPHSDGPYSYYYHSNTHSDNYYHTDSKDHSDTYRIHADDTPRHIDRGGSHYDYASPTYGRHWNVRDHQNYYSPGWHSNRAEHSDSTDHSNSTPHRNTRHRNTRHTNGHDNNYYHSNTRSSYYYHSNTGFDHQNYIPSEPHFFNISEDQELLSNTTLRDTINIGFYAYDKNIDGYGTQDNASKTVLYYLQIKPVSGGVWTTLVNGSTSETYSLNTKNYAEGKYYLKAWATNYTLSANGVTKSYVGVPTTITVEFLQNMSPTISVTNENEFVNFTFGYDGALSPSEVYTRYEDGLYAGATQDQKEGILVRVKMKDSDSSSGTIQNWQKGKVYLKNSSGTNISVGNIIWENGSTIISSENQYKDGLVFFDKSTYTSLGDLTECKIIVEVSDYLDSAATQQIGSTVTHQVMTGSESIDVDITKPNGSLKINNGAAVTESRTVTLNITGSDNTSGIKDMMISNDPNFVSGSGYNGADPVWESFKTSRSWIITDGGGNKNIYIKLRDKLNNYSVYSNIIEYKIVPTIDTPTLAGVLYDGKDVTLSSTGTNIDTSNYKIFYTNKLTSPSISNASTPGTDWVNGTKDVTGSDFISMNVTGTTSVSKVIPASTFANVDWTYATLQIEVISVTGHSAYAYIAPAKSLNNPGDTIGYIGHNQKVRIYESGREIIVSGPDTSVQQYNPNATDVANLSNNNTFEDGAPLKYRAEFDVQKPADINSVNVYFDFNLYNNTGIEFTPTEVVLQRLNNDGSITDLKTYSGAGIGITKEGRNRYYISADNTLIDPANKYRYFVEYRGDLSVEPDYVGGTEQISNEIEVEIITHVSNYGDSVDEQSPNRKRTIKSNITRQRIQYQ